MLLLLNACLSGFCCAPVSRTHKKVGVLVGEIKHFSLLFLESTMPSCAWPVHHNLFPPICREFFPHSVPITLNNSPHSSSPLSSSFTRSKVGKSWVASHLLGSVPHCELFLYSFGNMFPFPPWGVHSYCMWLAVLSLRGFCLSQIH